jgi:hypothetical protein
VKRIVEDDAGDRVGQERNKEGQKEKREKNKDRGINKE